MTQYTPMIQQYLAIKADQTDAFLFFRLGDFYELFFDDAIEASRLLEITLTGREGGAEERIPMCGVPYHSAANYINRLVEMGHKVAICEQVEDPAMAKGVVRREVVRVITPGTRMEGNAIPEKTNNFLVGLVRNDNQTSLGAIDLSTGECYVTDLFGSDQALFDEVNSYHPAEMIVDDRSITSNLLEYFTKLGNCLVQSYSSGSEHDDVRRIKQQFPETYQLLKSPLANKVVGMLLHYLDRTQKRSISHVNQLQVYEADSFMVLDVFSRRNLELVSTIRDQSKKGTLLHHLDHTVTAMGGRMLRRWIEKPLMNVNMIENRLHMIEQLLLQPLLLDEIKSRLRDVYDLERLVSRIAYGSANARDLVMIKRSLENVLPLQQAINASDIPILQEYVKVMDDCCDVLSMIDEAIVDDPPISVREGGMIKDGYHQLLDQYKMASTNGKTWLAELEQKERERTKIRTLKIGYNKVFGYYIEVTKANIVNLPEGLYERKQTLSNAERYVTQELKEKEALILEAEEKMVSLEYEILLVVRENVAKHITRLQNLANQLAYLDVIHAFTKVSMKFGYSKPRFVQKRGIHIKAGRHPVVESMVHPEPFIPNDTVLPANRNQILLITGPNMAGKSTYMRQVAINVIMAQMGCFVPAEATEMSIVDRIFTRIGAADDVAGGQSTFMVEMVETRQAITQATPDSLLLLDEIGRGTSTYDGMALAQAIIEFIHENVGAMTLFSTHYHELTDLEERLDRLINVHAKCMEKDGRVLFLHKIEQGKADRSYGIHVAQLANMPEAVLERAQSILLELEAKDTIQRDETQLAFDFLASNVKEQVSASVEPVDRTAQLLVKALDDINILNTTPLEALQHLFQLKQLVSDKKG